MNFIVPQWPVGKCVKSLITTRMGGVSLPPYDTMNLGNYVGDDPEHVSENRGRLLEFMPSEPKWLSQVHGKHVVDLDSPDSFEGDGAFTKKPNVVCAIMTADCLPVLLAGKDCVGAAHAGWRGLAAGILEETVNAMGEAGFAYLGPAIGRDAFEVGEEVLDAFPDETSAFRRGADGKWHADLYAIATMKLAGAGVSGIHGGNFCTHRDSPRFFSYRRDGKTGRMGSFIWLEEA